MKKLEMPSRRKAIKNIALGVGSLGLLPLTSSFRYSEENKLGIALVGLGNYATKLAPAIQQTRFCTLQGIVTGTPKKASKWQKEYAINSQHIYDYKNFDTIENDASIDVVYIVHPNFMHTEYTIRGLNAGNHVICDKQMAIDTTEYKVMISPAKKNKSM